MKAGALGGTALRVHPLFPCMALALTLMGRGQAMAALLLALLSHESAHMLMAKAFRMPVYEMELTPFGAVARIEGMAGATPLQAFFVAAAGPLCSFLACAVCAALVHFGWVSPGFALAHLNLNAALGFINLLPVLPLDGGRMLRALLSLRFDHRSVTRALGALGVALGLLALAACLFAALNGVYNFTLAFAGCYLMYAARLESRLLAAQYMSALIGRREKLSREGVLRGEFLAAGGDLPVWRLLCAMNAGKAHIVQVLDGDGLRPLGTLTDDALIPAVLDAPQKTLAQVLAAQKNGAAR